MDYWQKTRGFRLSGTKDANVMLASKPSERKFLLIRYYWITEEYRQMTAIVSTPEEALALLDSALVSN